MEAGDRATLQLLALLEEVSRHDAGSAPADEASRVTWLRAAVQTYRALHEHAPERVASFRERVERFDRALATSGLSAADLSRPFSARAAVRLVFRECAAILVGAPAACVGIAIHGVPYRAVDLVVRRMRRTDEEEATDKIAAGILFFPLTWLLEAWLAWRLAGGWGLAGFALALVPAGLFAIAWRERLARLVHGMCALARFLRDREWAEALRAEQRGLATEVAALARLAPGAAAVRP